MLWLANCINFCHNVGIANVICCRSIDQVAQQFGHPSIQFGFEQRFGEFGARFWP